MGWTTITDWDDAYANRDHIPDPDAYPPRWQAAAAAVRDRLGARARLGVTYGPGARQALDLFLPDGAPRGLAVFVHGGYWRRFERGLWSHLAVGPLARGWAVAMPSYTLAPATRIAAITREVGAAITRAAAGIAGPIVLAGHSAGGHLASRMVCADTPLAEAITARIAHVLSISGVHDLRPLLRTAMNADLRLDPSEAAAESPALLTPLPGTRLTAWVGGDERPEFIRQSALLANVWTGLGAATRSVVEPGLHHFDVIDSLATPDGALARALTDI
ncbi:MAG: alpha/beta hydrolase [Thermohalobaculum sp.]|nr:alpha/beta hydrolase [Thermohalobaculum sp.]